MIISRRIDVFQFLTRMAIVRKLELVHSILVIVLEREPLDYHCVQTPFLSVTFRGSKDWDLSCTRPFPF